MYRTMYRSRMRRSGRPKAEPRKANPAPARVARQCAGPCGREFYGLAEGETCWHCAHGLVPCRTCGQYAKVEAAALADGRCPLCACPGVPVTVPGSLGPVVTGKVCGDLLWFRQGSGVVLVSLVPVPDGSGAVPVSEHVQGVFERKTLVPVTASVPWARGWMVTDTEGRPHWWQTRWDSSD